MAKRKKPDRCPACGGTKFVDAVDNEGNHYRGCSVCTIQLQHNRRELESLATFNTALRNHFGR